MIRFLADEDFSRRIVEGLRLRGYDVVTAHDVGRANRRIPDNEVLEFAIAERRVVLTHNRRHFKRLHWSTEGRHAGIVVCSQRADPAAATRSIIAAVAGSLDCSGQLINIVRGN